MEDERESERESGWEIREGESLRECKGKGVDGSGVRVDERV